MNWRRRDFYNQMIENDFTDALKNKEFIIYYQPKIDVVTEKVIGAEALVRCQRTDGSMISPENFIPIYEKNGQIQKLDAYVFGQVCRLQKRVLDESKKLLSVSVNLSRSSILCEEVVEQYAKIVKEYDIPITCVPSADIDPVELYKARQAIRPALLRYSFFYRGNSDYRLPEFQRLFL